MKKTKVETKPIELTFVFQDHLAGKVVLGQWRTQQWTEDDAWKEFVEVKSERGELRKKEHPWDEQYTLIGILMGKVMWHKGNQLRKPTLEELKVLAEEV
jgi:hypothetical protein